MCVPPRRRGVFACHECMLYVTKVMNTEDRGYNMSSSCPWAWGTQVVEMVLPRGLKLMECAACEFSWVVQHAGEGQGPAA